MNQTVTSSNNNLLSVVLFAGTLFISATLMFILQPMFGKILLPLLGGTPAVWNTCMVFYQILLFLGYLYAHLLSAKLKTHRQIQIHAALILISFIALPIGLPENTVPPTESNPTWWLLWTLFLSIGLPFFVVSTTAPLLQKWFSHTGHHTSHDPYYLYTASNVGSLLSLLSYPFLVEPNIGLSLQKTLWSGGFVGLCVLIISCGLLLWRSQQPDDSGRDAKSCVSTPPEPLTWTTKLHWLILALVPSSLLLGLTNFISTDIASVPLLWIIPLTIYLLSFVIVFSKWNDKAHPWMIRLQPFFLIPFLAFAFIDPADLPYWAYLILHTIAFFFAVMVCHGELVRLRPHTQYLTSFYLMMSFAGMLGGMFNTFVAPFIFNAVYEYPIMIVAALLLRPGTIGAFNFKLALQIIIPLLFIAGGWIAYSSVADLLEYFDYIALSLMASTIVIFFFRNKPVAYAGATAAVIVLSMGLHGLASNTWYQERSFFGVFSVRDAVIDDENKQAEKIHELYHGTTKHGSQRLADSLQTIPYMYYSRPGPMGQLFKEFDNQNQNWTIGTVGLGAGALLCYSKPQQHWTIYEIDPLVIKIAQDSHYFHYLERCGKNAVMKVGDARLSIANEPAQKFDLLIMDAFSSDSVPTHLLTQEALELYFSKLKPTGILAFHITNRHLLIKKVIADHAQRMKFSALVQEFKPQQGLNSLIVATDWVVMAKNPQNLDLLAQSQLGYWQKLPLYFDMKPWTDDFTNIIEIWK
jgi:hypothetical protein